MILPEHISEVHPRVRILHGCKSARLPGESAVLLDEAFEGAAARASIQPDRHFVYGITDLRLKYKEQRSGIVLFVNRYQARVHLPNVKVDLGQMVNLVSCAKLEF